MTETGETVEHQGWLKRNWSSVLGILILISHGFVSEWISLPLYLGAPLLIYANFLVLSSKDRNLIGWLKTNLFVLAAMGGMFLLISALSRLMVFLSGLVPESVAAFFHPILAVGVILYLIGVGFYFVEKTTRD